MQPEVQGFLQSERATHFDNNFTGSEKKEWPLWLVPRCGRVEVRLRKHNSKNYGRVLLLELG